MQETQEMQVRFLSWEDPLEEGTATHSSMLAWRILWTEEPGRVQSRGSQESDMTEGLSTPTHVWKLQQNDTYKVIYKTEINSQTQKTNLWLPKGKGGGIN